LARAVVHDLLSFSRTPLRPRARPMPLLAKAPKRAPTEAHSKEQTNAVLQPELASLRRTFQRLQEGSFRFPWEIGGCTELLALMRPGEDDIEGKLFSFVANLNIFSGLLVSGLIGYVLEPTAKIEGMNELTGVPNQAIVHVQMLLAHMNLISSTVMMTCTTYMCLFSTCETPRTILRCVAKGRSLWVYMFATFLQTFLIAAQACLAALLNVQPRWATIIIVVDMVLFWSLLNFSLNMIFSIFPLAHFSWLFCSPVPLLRWVFGDRDVYKRLFQALVAEAAKSLNLEGFEESLLLEEQEHEQEDSETLAKRGELRVFLRFAVPSLEGEQLECVAHTLLAEGLTVGRLVRTAAKPQGFQTLFLALDTGAENLTCGQRLDIINTAVEQAGQRHTDV